MTVGCYGIEMPERRHHGHPTVVKRREAAFEHLRAELLREAGNRVSFNQAKNRVLSYPQVQNDPALRSMLQGVIAEREALFRQNEPHLAPHPTIAAPSASEGKSSFAPRGNPEAEARSLLTIVQRQFHDAVSHFHEAEARGALQKLESIWTHHPTLCAPDDPKHYRDELEHLVERRRAFQKHVKEVARRATEAAAKGDEMHASRAIRRLSSIHAMHPDLLPDAQFDRIRSQIQHASDRHEDRVLAAKLLAREREVATEISRLAHRIHHFHRVARSLPHDQEAFHRAEADYLRAVEAVQAHDAEWLGGVILELVELLSEFHRPPKAAQAQVDRFLEIVRSALSRLRKEIRAVHIEEHPPKASS